MPQSADRRLPFWGGLALCVLAGAAHLTDAALFMDAASGFAARGPALARCAAWAAVAAVIWWLGRGAADCPALQPGGRALLTVPLRLTGTLLAVRAILQLAELWRRLGWLPAYLAQARPGALQLFRTVMAQPGVPGLFAGGLLALLTALWLLRQGPRALTGAGPLPAAGAGALLLLWPFWLALQRFLVDPAAVERLPATLRVLSAAALLLFAAALLRAAYVPAQPGGRGLFRAGMLCFLAGTCMELPQTLFELAHGAAAAGSVLTAAVTALFGLCGLAAAWLAVGPQTPQAQNGPAQNGPKN